MCSPCLKKDAFRQHSCATRQLTLVAVALGTLTLVACEREARRFSEPMPASRAPNTIALSELQAGTPTHPIQTSGPYEYNAYAIAQGKRLFDWYNCSGCHAHGGGAIGPPLMDGKWIYGSAPANIYATILEGRPNGMPSFRGRVPQQQVWQLVAYVQSMSGQIAKDASPGRADHLNVKPSEQSASEEEPKPSSLPTSAQR